MCVFISPGQRVSVGAKLSVDKVFILDTNSSSGCMEVRVMVIGVFNRCVRLVHHGGVCMGIWCVEGMCARRISGILHLAEFKWKG